jgi:hypothetical protein
MASSNFNSNSSSKRETPTSEGMKGMGDQDAGIGRTACTLLR